MVRLLFSFYSFLVVTEAANREVTDRLVQTAEYAVMQETLRARDVFRHFNPTKGGFTQLGRYNALLSNKQAVKRTEFILAFDSLDCTT